MKSIVLNNGIKMPSIGFGTFPQKSELVTSAKSAIESNYHLFDSSDNYLNEEYLGRAIGGGYRNIEMVLL